MKPTFRLSQKSSAPRAGGRTHSGRAFAWRVVAGSLLGASGLTLAGCTGGVPPVPIHSTVITDYGTVGYDSKGGLTIQVDAQSGK